MPQNMPHHVNLTAQTRVPVHALITHTPPSHSPAHSPITLYTKDQHAPEHAPVREPYLSSSVLSS